MKNDEKLAWELHDGSKVSTAALKRMFAGLGCRGSIPSPAQRKMLGIVKIGKA